MRPPPEAVRVALRREALCAALVRAFTGDPALDYRGGRLCRHAKALPLQAPHLRGNALEDDFASLRGAADGAAVRLAYSDAALHRRLRPEHRAARLLFEVFEQVRCEAMADPSMLGLARNLRHRFESWSRAYCRAGLADDHSGILVYTVVQIVWSRVTGYPVLEEAADLIEATRAGIVPEIGVHLAGLRRHRFDQRAYSNVSGELSLHIASMLDRARSTFAGVSSKKTRKSNDPLTSFSLWIDFDEFEASDASEEALPSGAGPGEGGGSGRFARCYRAYTTQFDREVRAAALVRQALLREYREALDERISDRGINAAKIARVLQATLSVAQRDGWSFGEEDGRIDGRRLAQVVGSPAERRIFMRERIRPRGDCVIGFLIDCSASMKGHVGSVAMLVDTLVRASEMAGVDTEVLGFTTGAWNGGRAREQWLADGRPSHPGRLNALCHMVLKRASDSWRRARADIAALFKADLFRESIDGEAIEWACARLNGQARARRILVVMSDGSPMDAATVQANDAAYLDRHLSEVLARREASRDVEVVGLGIGCDLSVFYRHSRPFDATAPLDTARLADIARWLAARR